MVTAKYKIGDLLVVTCNKHPVERKNWRNDGKMIYHYIQVGSIVKVMTIMPITKSGDSYGELMSPPQANYGVVTFTSYMTNWYGNQHVVESHLRPLTKTEYAKVISEMI
jgi:hypothetical protein